MKTKTGIILKFGDKVLNQYASERNPHRIGVVIKISSQFIFLTDMKKGYWQLPNDRQLKIEVVGSIFSTLQSAKEENYELNNGSTKTVYSVNEAKEEVKSAEEINEEPEMIFFDNEAGDITIQVHEEIVGFVKSKFPAEFFNAFVVVKPIQNASQFQSVQSKEVKRFTGHWWCEKCKRSVPPVNVTFEEIHEDCGYPVEWIDAESVKGEGGRTAVKKIITMPLECGHLYNLCKTCHNPHNYGNLCDSETKFPSNCPLESYKHSESKDKFGS